MRFGSLEELRTIIFMKCQTWCNWPDSIVAFFMVARIIDASQYVKPSFSASCIEEHVAGSKWFSCTAHFSLYLNGN